jgi:hypothetical protein
MSASNARASRDARAYDAHNIGLGRIRTRAATVDALSELVEGAPASASEAGCCAASCADKACPLLPTLLLWLPNEPYVPVRARMVALVAKLSPHDAENAHRVLVELAENEREPEVKAALARALSPPSPPTKESTEGKGRGRLQLEAR